MAISQLDDMRELIQTELVPRVVIRSTDMSENGKDVWVCMMCNVETEYDPATAHNPLMAKHTTFCKLGKVLGVIE